MLKIIHFVHSLQLTAGGPSYSVPALARAIQAEGVDVELWTSDPHPPQIAGLPVREVTSTGLVSALRVARKAQSSVIVHDHGLWLPWNHAVAKAARIVGVPRVVSPRGMLEPWAMQHRKWKKVLAWWFYQQRDLRTAALLHATADQEEASFRSVGLTGPVLVAPNGVDFAEAALADHAPGRTERTLLFLSRIHPKKGLLDLVDAWKKIRVPGWRVVVAGPDEGGHLAVVKQAVRRAGLRDVFDFPGSLAGPSRNSAYQTADLFVLPSYSENFGLVVAEALATGVPVITTKSTPWRELETEYCGWWIDPGPEALAHALRHATSLSPETRREMGLRGRQLIETHYSWPAIARRMLPAYHQLAC